MPKDPERMHACPVQRKGRITSASAHNLKMPYPAGSQVSKTPFRFHSTTEAEDVVPTKGVASWTKEFFKALDLVQIEIMLRLDQSGMESASCREEILLAATKGSAGTEEDLRCLQLPRNIQ